MRRDEFMVEDEAVIVMREVERRRPGAKKRPPRTRAKRRLGGRADPI